MIVIVASSKMIPPLTDDLLAKITTAIAAHDKVVIRSSFMTKGPQGPDTTVDASAIESLAATLADKAGREVVRFIPFGGGRESTFKRDYKMVEGADAVLAIFDPSAVMAGGTGHVVKAALDRGIPVEAYTFDPDGDLIYIGSDEGNPFRVQAHSRPDVLRSLWIEQP